VSSDVSKVAYRIPLNMDPEDALAFFRAHIGEPEEVWGEDGSERLYFYYGTGLEYVKENPTDFKSFVKPCCDLKTGKWGIEVVIAIKNHGRHYHNGLTPDVLQGRPIDLEVVQEGLLDLGLSPEMVSSGKVYAYMWYNGVDEPVYME
jgi:hypothetical protein